MSLKTLSFRRKLENFSLMFFTCDKNSCPSLLVLNGGKCLTTFVIRLSSPISPLSSTVLCLLSKYSLDTIELAKVLANESISNKHPWGSSILSEIAKNFK